MYNYSAIECEAPSRPENSDMDYVTTTVNSTVNVTCKPGFILETGDTSMNITCTVNSSLPTSADWVDLPSSCKGKSYHFFLKEALVKWRLLLCFRVTLAVH